MNDTRSHARLYTMAALIAAFWPVWSWIAGRVFDRSGDRWEALAAITAVAFLWRDRELCPGARVGRPTIAALLAYAAVYAYVPPLVRALLAMSVLASACASLWYAKRVVVWLAGLLMLSAPLMSSIDFFAGYPLRVLVGDATAWLLQMQGLNVVRDGAVLSWGGKHVAIDAPCSGVKMLWTGAYLCCACAALLRLDNWRTLALGGATVVVVLAANVLRACALFYIEGGIIQAPAIAHDAIGLVMLAFAAGSLTSLSLRLAGVRHAH